MAIGGDHSKLSTVGEAFDEYSVQVVSGLIGRGCVDGSFNHLTQRECLGE
jgi:hypothetical protein